jgi:hypothetical protein
VSVRDHDYDLENERPIPLGRAAERSDSEAAVAATQITPADGHPLAAFRRFRMDVVLVEPHDEETNR